MSDQLNGQLSVDSSEENGTIFTNDQQNEVSVAFTASGTWNTGSKINYGPEGKVGTHSKNAPYPNNTLYALLAVNSNNEVVGEGANIELTLEADESIRFVVNDTHYPNNSGELTVDWEANRLQAPSGVTAVDGSDPISEYVKEHEAELEELRTAANALDFEGKWVIIGDPEYPQKREQYATTSVAVEVASPRIILYAAGDRDIGKGILLCRAFDMAIAVRTGGHQYSGYSSTSPENMQIDLSETYPEYEYDADNNVLRCGVSQGLGDWATKNNQNGIYLPMGVCATVNLGGHVHTGGWGIVARSHGLLADHVLAFEIILANGCKKRIVKPKAGITNQHNDDLFYAVLGGGRGGDFGIVTHWEFCPIRDKDYPNSACYLYVWDWDRDKMERAVHHMQKLSKLCEEGCIPSDYEFMLNITGRGEMNLMPERMRRELIADRGLLDREMPPLIQMWMCFTNKEGIEFKKEIFESFKDDEVCGRPRRLPTPLEDQNMPVSEGLAKEFIITGEREMEYPFVKRARPTMEIPDGFPQTYTDRMYEIMGEDGTVNDQHLVSQMQIYAGGILAENGEPEITSYSWRDVVLGMSYDSFYSGGGLGSVPHQTAEEWQRQNDEVFIGPESQKFADADMRMFAFTFGDDPLDKVSKFYYDCPEKYERLRIIKGKVDPKGIFSPDKFSLKPLYEKIPSAI